jgi:hypothetical protein
MSAINLPIGSGIPRAAREWVAGTETAANQALIDALADGEADAGELLMLGALQGDARAAAITVSELNQAEGKVLENIISNIKG